MTSFCFIGDNSEPGDADLFDQSDKLIEFDANNDTLAHLCVKAGVFPSLSQARKNGWDRAIPFGFNEIKCGKRIFYVWRRQYTPEQLNAMFPDYDKESTQ